jgi:hypothetical protein
MLKTTLAALLIFVPALVSGSEPFTIFSGSSERSPKQPQASMDSRGVAHVTFGVGDDVYYCRVGSDEKPSPLVAFRVPNMSLGMRRGPRIAHAGDSIVITAIGGPKGKGTDGDVLAYRTLDGGMSWLGPVKVNDIEASAREGLHSMTASDDGTLWCVWLDLRAKRTQLFASKSIDQGASWSKNQLVYKSPDGSICECCHPSVVAEGNFVHILFRNSLKGNRDMYLVSSDNQGETFGIGERLGLQHWSLNACPMDGGMLAIAPKGEVVSAWRRGGTIFTSVGEASLETMLENGEQPWIASGPSGTYVVWLTKRDGQLRLVKLGNGNSRIISENARDPIVAVGDGNESQVFVFWEQRAGDQVSIQCQLVH